VIPPDRSHIVIPYQRRCRDRSVLLHLSILMTIGDFGRAVQYWCRFANASAKFGFNFAKPARTILSKRQAAIANVFADSADGRTSRKR
jgi:hypothetical protein